MNLRLGASLLALLLAASFARAAGEDQAAGEGPIMISDQQGNLLTISNGFDGTAGFVRMTSVDSNRNQRWDRTHSDGYLERVTYAYLDQTGGLVMAGVRLVQGVSYIWIMKYSESGLIQWEQIDNTEGCTAFNIAGNASGDLWVAGSCQTDRNFSVRLLHFASNGGLAWARDYTEPGRDYVRNLNVDFADRADLTLEVVAGGQSTARTIVYDSYGSRLTAY